MKVRAIKPSDVDELAIMMEEFARHFAKMEGRRRCSSGKLLWLISSVPDLGHADF